MYVSLALLCLMWPLHGQVTPPLVAYIALKCLQDPSSLSSCDFFEDSSNTLLAIVDHSKSFNLVAP